MADRPILMSGPMVRALLGGRKTQTRRVAGFKFLDGQNPDFTRYQAVNEAERKWRLYGGKGPATDMLKCPYGQPGDRLWVRETFVIEDTQEYDEMAIVPTDGRPIRELSNDPDWGRCRLIPHYRATEPEPHIVPYDREDEHDDTTRWTPSIFMKRWASRLTLQLTDVRVERAQDISEDDAVAEGAYSKGRVGDSPSHATWTMTGDGWRHETPRDAFLAYIDTLNSKRGFPVSDNFWVWALTFDVIKQNIDQIGERDG